MSVQPQDQNRPISSIKYLDTRHRQRPKINAATSPNAARSLAPLLRTRPRSTARRELRADGASCGTPRPISGRGRTMSAIGAAQLGFADAPRHTDEGIGYIDRGRASQDAFEDSQDAQVASSATVVEGDNGEEDSQAALFRDLY